MALFDFNIADHPGLLEIKEKFKVLPVGLYRAHITATEFKTSGAGHEYLELLFEILGTEVNQADDPKEAHVGRRIWENLNFNHPTEGSRKMAVLNYGAICQHTGVLKTTDTRELHGISLIIKVGIQKNDPNRNSLDGAPWAPGIMPDPNCTVDNAVRYANAAPQAQAQAVPAWGAPVAQPQAAALPSPHAYPNGPATVAAPINTPPTGTGAVAGAYQVAMQYQQPQTVGPNGGAVLGNAGPITVVADEEPPF